MNRIVLVAFLFAGVAHSQVLPEVPDGVQAMSLSGAGLTPAAPSARTLDLLAIAERDHERDPDDADYIIWYGRRRAYAGDYRGAIEMFTEGIGKHPDDARMYRHRGHRYISIREFERAIADLERAAELIGNTPNETEPDGAPNALNIPVSSLHGNTWYHLGLAYYLVQDWENAHRAYLNGFRAGRNADNRVSTTHWLYMILRRAGHDEEAERVLENVSADMNVIENMSYHRLCLFYKGEISLEEMTADLADNPSGAAGAYGVANWHYYNGDVDEALRVLDVLVATDSWAAFGFIAAEADLATMQ